MWDPTGDSPFDRLPDDVVLQIFETLRDAKSLSVCTAICKRFHSLAPQTHSLLLSIPPASASHSGRARQTQANSLLAFATKFLIRPFRSLISKSPFSSATRCTCRETLLTAYDYYSPAYILRNFSEIRGLELRLPRHESCVRDGSALKWTAQFGSELQSCVIVGGTSISPIPRNCTSVALEEEEEEEEELRVPENEDLKLRIFWTISCLIAATARHSLLLEAVNDHRTVRSVTVTDELGQGRLTMNAKQIEELRRYKEKTKDEVMADDRRRVPALKIKMWIAAEMEVAEAGCVMKGATLVVIRPAEQEDSGQVTQLVRKAEQELGLEVDGRRRLFAEAANKLVKLKRSYTLEMNSF
ncbi:PREDICTED: F-box protein At4g18380-like [Ipomoea nil]|uniref:F-box protein At4g18380-like n=1 Tax=Ipomoea nil TaxID=35883 RepID=UPI000901927F|nr:PREDICTED: F-box protein At4g18380-like [Ipomoea nil]